MRASRGSIDFALTGPAGRRSAVRRILRRMLSNPAAPERSAVEACLAPRFIQVSPARGDRLTGVRTPAADRGAKRPAPRSLPVRVATNRPRAPSLNRGTVHDVEGQAPHRMCEGAFSRPRGLDCGSSTLERPEAAEGHCHRSAYRRSRRSAKTRKAPQRSAMACVVAAGGVDGKV